MIVGIVLLAGTTALLGFYVGWHVGFRDRKGLTKHWEVTANAAIASLKDVSSLRSFMDQHQGGGRK